MEQELEGLILSVAWQHKFILSRARYYLLYFYREKKELNYAIKCHFFPINTEKIFFLNFCIIEIDVRVKMFLIKKLIIEYLLISG